MKIKGKVTLFISFFITLIVVAITYLSVISISEQGEQRIATYKQESIEGVKNHLKDLVNVAYETIEQNHDNLSDVEYLSRFYERRLNNIIDSGEAIINRYKSKVKRGEITLPNAKREAIKEIRALRFDGGTGYIWINDTGTPFPKMIMHPTVPDLDGKVLDNPSYNNAMGRGKNLFKAFVDVTRVNKEGYVDYLWPKPTPEDLTDEVPKLSYVRRYRDWKWILGTGIYIDDAEEEIKGLIKENIKAMRYEDGTGYFWINDNTHPYPTMIMHPTAPRLDGKVLDDPVYNNAQGVDKNLFQAFVEVTSDEEGAGFVPYLWPKPTKDGLTERKEKISYVRLHKKTGWIIGTGAYIDNIDEAVAIKQAKIETHISQLIEKSTLVSAIFIVFSISISFLFAGTLSKPIRSLTDISEKISKGTGLEAPVEEIDRRDEIGDLARSIDRLRNSVRIMMTRMKR